MTSPLPTLPRRPLPDLSESLPADPLGAPPAAPIIGKGGPLRLPVGARRGRSHGERPPLPSLSALSRPNPTHEQARAQAASRAEQRKALRLAIQRERRQDRRERAAALAQAVTPERAAPAPSAPAPVAPAPAAPVAQRPHIPGRMAQPPISPRPGTQRSTLRQRIERQRRGAQAYNALQGEGENELAEPLRHVIPPAERDTVYSASAETARAHFTPEQRARIQSDAERTRAILYGERPAEMGDPLRHVRPKPVEPEG